ncbi:MAG: TonB family protein [Dysgonomonas sp.]|nr:TonB family protein [Dysgonomonas sp.]
MKRMKLILFLLSVTFSISLSGQTKEEKVFVQYETMPSYPDGVKAMYDFIKEHLLYPVSAIEEKVEGRVMVRFLVSRTGCIEDAQVIKGIHPDCDSIAVRIVRKMPKWIPGSSRGIANSVYFTLPIHFKLSDATDENTICFIPDEYASYPGGTEAMLKFIKENLRWPNTEFDFQGRVILRFLVTNEGKIDRVEVLRGIDPKVDIEAIKVINLMPDWIPGKYKGKSINTYFTIPVSFRL